MEKKPTSGLAVAALVTGIIALVSSFVPLLNLLSFPFVVLAIIFGAIGVWQTVKGAKSGKGLAIAGLALGVLGLLVTVVMYGGAAASSESDDVAPASGAAAQQVDEQSGAASAQQTDAQTEEPAAYGVAIDGCRVTEDYEGKPAAVVSYTFTNNSDDAVSFAVALNPQVFQNGVQLNTAIGADWDSEKYLSDVKPGASTTVEIGYKLEDESDITVEVTELISFDDTVLAEQTFPVV